MWIPKEKNGSGDAGSGILNDQAVWETHEWKENG
jgi:hypothetical protein